MKTINKILNATTIVVILFLIIKGLFDSQQSIVNSQQSESKYNLTLSLEDVKSYYPEADSIALENINLYNVFKNGNQIGTVVNTSPYSDEIYGYNSITPLTIYLDNDDKIVEVEICDNKESRGFLNKVISSGYFDSWDGLSVEEATNHHVDAVSGCTYTSTAVAKSLQARMSQLSQQKRKSFSWDWSLFLRQSCVLIVTILALVSFFNPKKKTLRLITLLLSVAVLGFWNNSLLSIALFYNWITNGISLAIQIPILIIALLAVVLPMITKKAFYCQYLCPFGAVQEFAGMIRLKAKDKSLKAKGEGQNTKANVFKFFAVFRRIVLLGLLLVVALGVGLDLSLVEPFPIFNYQSIGFGIAIFAGVIIVASIFIKKPWCNYLCPTGTLLEMFRKLI